MTLKQIPPANRFSVIISSLLCDLPTISQMLQESFQKCISPGIEFAVDEFLAKYYSRGKQRATCPQRYIQEDLIQMGFNCFWEVLKLSAAHSFLKLN